MKASDYIAERIKKETNIVFGVTGGCIVNLLNSFHKKRIRIIPMHNEVCASIAADAYARVSKKLGVCFGTSGPGTTNLLTGTCCSYFDSIPVLTIVGQVNSKYLNYKDRQTGFQEVDGVSIFKPITKYACNVQNKNFLQTKLKHAIQIAKEPRQGPTFISICEDVQRDNINLFNLFTIEKANKDYSKELLKLRDLLLISTRPLFILGAGIKSANCEDKIRKLVNSTIIPYILTWGAKDLFNDHPDFGIDFGITGKNNYEIKKYDPDLIIMIGTKMDTHQVPEWKSFFPEAKKVSIGLDFPHEVDLKIDIPIENLNLDYLNMIFKRWK